MVTEEVGELEAKVAALEPEAAKVADLLARIELLQADIKEKDDYLAEFEAMSIEENETAQAKGVLCLPYSSTKSLFVACYLSSPAWPFLFSVT